MNWAWYRKRRCATRSHSSSTTPSPNTARPISIPRCLRPTSRSGAGRSAAPIAQRAQAALVHGAAAIAGGARGARRRANQPCSRRIWRSAFSQTGERTLLIDTNLRTPRQRELFGLADDEGLTQILGGRLPLAMGSRSAGFPEPVAVVRGRRGAKPAGAARRATFADLMEVLPVSFDVVIATAPAGARMRRCATHRRALRWLPAGHRARPPRA